MTITLCVQMYFHPAGHIVRAPAMPPMFDYEYWPQDVSGYFPPSYVRPLP